MTLCGGCWLSLLTVSDVMVLMAETALVSLICRRPTVTTRPSVPWIAAKQRRRSSAAFGLLLVARLRMSSLSVVSLLRLLISRPSVVRPPVLLCLYLKPAVDSCVLRALSGAQCRI